MGREGMREGSFDENYFVLFSGIDCPYSCGNRRTIISHIGVAI